jgi:hypothetical protein
MSVIKRKPDFNDLIGAYRLVTNQLHRQQTQSRTDGTQLLSWLKNLRVNWSATVASPLHPASSISPRKEVGIGSGRSCLARRFADNGNGLGETL